MRRTLHHPRVMLVPSRRRRYLVSQQKTLVGSISQSIRLHGRWAEHTKAMGKSLCNVKYITLTDFIRSMAAVEIHSIVVPMMNCMGHIQDFRRPIAG
jgi:hypothetical protein